MRDYPCIKLDSYNLVFEDVRGSRLPFTNAARVFSHGPGIVTLQLHGNLSLARGGVTRNLSAHAQFNLAQIDELIAHLRDARSTGL